MQAQVPVSSESPGCCRSAVGSSQLPPPRGHTCPGAYLPGGSQLTLLRLNEPVLGLCRGCFRKAEEAPSAPPASVRWSGVLGSCCRGPTALLAHGAALLWLVQQQLAAALSAPPHQPVFAGAPGGSLLRAPPRVLPALLHLSCVSSPCAVSKALPASLKEGPSQPAVHPFSPSPRVT